MNQFNKGDTVRRINHDNSKDMPVGSTWVVKAVERGGWLQIEGYIHGMANSMNFELIEPARRKGVRTVAPLSVPLTIKVPMTAVEVALTRMVKEQFGINATVTKIIETFGGAVELILKEEAA